MSESPTAPQKLVPSTFSHQTESLVRDMILSGSLTPGQRLNEVAMSAELGISRGPLREALQRLVGEGLVTVISHRGTFIRQFDHDEIVELYELRTALETHAARLACRRASDDDLHELEEMLDETADRITGTTSKAYPSDLDFHARLLEFAQVAALTRAWVEVQQKLTLARVRSARQPIRARAALVEHLELVHAIRARDEERTVEITAEHLEHSMRSALTALNLEDGPDDGNQA